MQQVMIAPTNLHSLSMELARDLARLAREKRVGLHTHLGETVDEIEAFQKKHNCSPLSFAERTGWTGADTSFAHGINFSDEDLNRIAKTGIGISHCPSSNMRLGSGVLDISALVARGIPIGIGVDGGASNEAANFLFELRDGLLLQRATRGAQAMSISQMLNLGTRGGAFLLDRPSLGVLAPGHAADLIGFDLGELGFCGGLADPIGMMILGSTSKVALSIVNGKILVQNQEVIGFDWEEETARANSRANTLLAS